MTYSIRVAPLAALLVALAGCDAVATDPALADATTAAPALAAVASDTRSASGSGHLTVSDEFRTFTFHARDRAGTASGQFNLVSRHTDLRLKGDASCVRFDGDRVFVAGLVTKSNSPDAVWAVGHHFVFVAEDNGEGAGAPPDAITLFQSFVGPPTQQAIVDAFCGAADPFALLLGFTDLLEVEAGNVQIR